ncbi:MAG: tyrosine-type recombinase/integrase [Candidatus Acidiferrales bacterium]
MFDQIFERSDALRRQLAGPLREARLTYLGHRAEQGAPRSSLRKLAQYLLVVTERLNLQPEGTVTTTQIERAADQWARRHGQHHKIKDGFSRKSKSCFVCVATNWLRFLRRLQACRPQRFAQLLANFARYLDQEKGLASRTIITRCWVVEDFLGRTLHSKRALHEITIRQIDEVLARKGTDGGYSRRGIQSYASGLRTFFRYAEQQNLCRRGLADAIKAPRIYRNEALPASPSWEDVQRLLANTEGDRPTSIRDRAILMLLAVYGLRSGEVRSLRLEDIDWENDRLHLWRSKTRCTQTFPLCTTVAVSILRYLREVRPRTGFREIFLTLCSPFRPLTSSAVFEIVRHNWQFLGPAVRPRGPHALRHACATRLIDCGLTMKEIGDLLGHRKVDSTRIYTKVDLPHLRQVADVELGDSDETAHCRHPICCFPQVSRGTLPHQ